MTMSQQIAIFIFVIGVGWLLTQIFTPSPPPPPPEVRMKKAIEDIIANKLKEK